MIELKEVTLKNFYSVGNLTQKVEIDEGQCTLIIGDNVDYSAGNEAGTIRNGVGKAQPLSAKIRTQYGWTTMGEIKLGQILLTPEGGTAVVQSKHPQGIKKIYEIHFKDGKKTRSCKEHLWELSTGEVVDTLEIYKRLKNGSQVSLPSVNNLMLPYNNIGVDAYLLGLVYIDDDYRFVDGNEERYVIKTFEEEVLRKVIELDPSSKMVHNGIALSLSVSRGLKRALADFTIEQLDLHTRKMFLTAVFDLLAYEGTNEVTDKEYIHLSFSKESVANDIRQLVWSLGGLCKKVLKVNYSSSEVVKTGSKDFILKVRLPNISEYFSFDKINFDFYHDDVLFNDIEKITYVGEEEACCIKITSDRELYITDNYIPTHNTTIINAISYALYGDTITKPRKKAAIINYFNGKDMLVTLKFKVNGINYYIERGQKPNIMRFVQIMEDGSENDLSQGANANTDKEIERILDMSYLMMKYIMLMSTYTQPFMAEEAAKQRSIIEELLGIGILSEKAELIKEKERHFNIEQEKEQVRINTVIESNKRIENALVDLLNKEKSWNINQTNTINGLKEELGKLSNVDIALEIETHKHNALVLEATRTQQALNAELKRSKMLVESNTNEVTRLHGKLNHVFNHATCHECNHILNAEEETRQKEKLQKLMEDKVKVIDTEIKVVESLEQELSKITLGEVLPTFYKKVDDAYAHEKAVSLLEAQIENMTNEVCPYTMQIQSISEGDLATQEVSYKRLEEIDKILKHYKYLKKLLTHKDSFLRKVIINRALPFLNSRLRHYLDILSLPHSVEFDADLSFNITHMGAESDYSLLSRGEQNRLTYSLNLAFRDLFEQTRQEINVLFVDELLDFGVDSTGAIAGLGILKTMAYNGKATFLVTHKEELVERVPNVVYVKKENGFTSYEKVEQ